MLKQLKKTLICAILTIFTATSVNADIIRIDELKALQRNPKADRIADGAHDKFDNLYINYGNIENVKGRDRLNSTAHTDIVVNGLFYYENQANTTKKIIVAESDELVTYDIDGTNRTQIASGLTNEKWDAEQIGDTMYLTSSTNGLYKWPGTGSATLVASVAAPSAVDFTVSANAGGLTPGLSCSTVCLNSTNGTASANCSTECPSGIASCNGYCCGYDGDGSCIDNDIEACVVEPVVATNTVYKYKITKYNTLTGIESEASTADSVSLTGPNTVVISCTSSAADNIAYAGEKTSTTGTLAAAPSAPFDGYCIYRTVASGEDYFRLGCVKGGSSVYTDGKPDVSLGSPLDTTIDTVAPPSFRYIEEYKGAIFVAENETIKFSKLPTAIITDADQYWLDSDELQVSGNIRGMKSVGDSLLVFTTESIFQITGFGADSFRLIPIVRGVGAISDETIEVDTNGDVIFFAGTSGFYKLKIGQQDTDTVTGTLIDNTRATLTKLSSPNMDNVFRGEDSQIILDPANYALSHSYYDSDNDRYFVYINNNQFIFDQKSSGWTNIPATNMSATVWRKSPNSNGVGVMLDNSGFFFNNWTGYENGIESGTVTGLPTSSTTNTLTCSTCAFNITNDGLKGLWIYIENDNQEYHQILSNTATEITITDTWTTNPINSDIFYVAYIIPKWRTKQYSFIKPPDESKIAILFINHNKSESTQSLDVFAYQEKSVNGVYVASKDLSQKFIDVFNTRMRSSWVQWEFRSYVYNISNTIAAPIDIVSYAVDAEAEKAVSRNG